MAGRTAALQKPTIQALLFLSLTAIIYLILARPVEAVTDFTLIGDYAFLTAGPVGFRVLDVSNPEEPEKIGSYNTLGYANSLEVKDKLVFIADGRDGLYILDITNPEIPSRLSRIDTPGYAQDIAIIGSHAFIADGKSGLRVFDVTTPSSPQAVKDAVIPGNISLVVASGKKLYIVDNQKTLRIYQATDDPKNMYEIDSFQTEGRIRGITVDNDNKFAYLALDKSGIMILDLSNPTIKEGKQYTYSNPGQARYITVDGIYAFVAAGEKGLRILDLSNLENIEEITSFDTWGYTTKVALQDPNVFIADGVTGLRSLKADVIINTKLKSSVPSIKSEDIYKAGEYVYLADGERGLRIFHRTANNLAEVSFYDTPGYSTAVSIQNNRAYVTDQNELVILDVLQTGKTPVLLGVLEGEQGSDLQDVKVQDRYAFLANASELWTVDVVDPTKPILLQKEKIEGKAVGLFLMGDIVYVAGGEGGLNIVNVLDRSFPTLLVNLPLQGFAQAIAVVAVNDNLGLNRFNADPKDPASRLYAYVAAGKGGLRVVDVTDPKQPKELSFYPTIGAASDVVVVNDILYLADNEGVFYLYNLADPVKPSLVSTQNMGAPLQAIFVEGKPDQNLITKGEAAYMAAFERGIRILGVSDANQPGPKENFDFAVYYQQFSRNKGNPEDAHIYVLDSPQGVRVIDVSNENEPREVGAYYSPGQAQQVTVAGAYAYVADGQAGLQVVDIRNPLKPVQVATFHPQNLVGSVNAVMIDPSAKDRLYLAVDQGNNTSEVWIINVSNPTLPTRVGAVSGLPGSAIWITPYSHYVLVSCQRGGLASISVQDPKAPQLVGFLSQYKDLRSLAIVGNYALAAGGVDGLLVLDVGRPLDIQTISITPTLGPVRDVFIDSIYAFVALDRGGVQIYDISNIKHLVQISSSTEAKNALMVDAQRLTSPESEGDGQQSTNEKHSSYKLFVADGSYGLKLFGASKDGQVSQAGIYETPGTSAFLEIIHYIVLKYQDILQSLSDAADSLGLSDLSYLFNVARKGFTEWVENISKRFGTPWPETPPSEKAGWTIRRVFIFDVFILGVLGAFLWAAFVGQYSLPVRGFSQRLSAAGRLMQYMARGHGSIARVKNGILLRDEGDEKRRGPGVILVDYCSAVMLEKRLKPYPIIVRQILSLFRIRKGSVKTPYGTDSTGRPIPVLRVEGPGIIFTPAQASARGPRFDETPVAAADLRLQVRSTIARVQAATREGIELSTSVYCVFTLGQNPDILKVTYLEGVESAENLRVIHLEDKTVKDGRDKEYKVKVIKSLLNELDAEDKLEIHQYVQQNKDKAGSAHPLLKDGEPREKTYLFDRDRIFLALASRAVDDKEKMPLEWTELPEKVATEILRNMLALEFYDNLYRPTDPEIFPLKDLKSNFVFGVRSQGLLAFQFIAHRSQPLAEGQEWIEDQLEVLPTQELRGPKVLRARGIKVVTAGFSELVPKDEDVYFRWLDTWRAYWQKDSAKTTAKWDLLATRIRNAARIQAQKDMVFYLSDILRSQIPREALALRVLQTLEAVGADPATRKNLSPEVVSMLKTLHDWMIPK